MPVPLAVALLWCLLLLAPGLAAADYAGTQAELDEVQQRIRSLDRELARSDRERDALRTALQDAERAAADAASKLEETQQALTRLRRAQQRTEVRVREAEEQLAADQRLLAAQLRAAWLMGRQPQLRLLLEQDGPARLSRLQAYFERAGRASQQQLERTLAAQQELAQAIAEQSAARQTLAASEDRQRRLLQQLEARRKERTATLDALQRRIREGRASLEAAQRDERAIETLMDGLRQALADIPAEIGDTRPIAELRGQLPWPVSGPVLASFGQNRSSGLRWKGIWIGSEAGTPVRAVARGRVAWAGWMHRYGLVVVVEHDGGYFSLYGHAQQSLKRVGEWVDGGTPVVTAGDTGGQSRPGVYLELRRGADAIDPIGWLQRRG